MQLIESIVNFGIIDSCDKISATFFLDIIFREKVCQLFILEFVFVIMWH